MQYDRPIMELIVFKTEDVIRTSLTGEGSGGGPEVGGDGDQDWNY